MIACVSFLNHQSEFFGSGLIGVQPPQIDSEFSGNGHAGFAGECPRRA
jgi:hypothetical protein